MSGAFDTTWNHYKWKLGLCYADNVWNIYRKNFKKVARAQQLWGISEKTKCRDDGTVSRSSRDVSKVWHQTMPPKNAVSNLASFLELAESRLGPRGMGLGLSVWGVFLGTDLFCKIPRTCQIHNPNPSVSAQYLMILCTVHHQSYHSVVRSSCNAY